MPALAPGLIDRALSSIGIVRDLMNIRRRHRRLMKDAARFNTICSAMDTIGDTSQALRAYGQSNAGGTDEAYLVAYGALQALYLQQDAVFWLCKLLEIVPIASFKSPGKWALTVPALAAARLARNSSIGHPVRRDQGGPFASFFIVQNSLNAGGFQVIEATEDGRKFVGVNLRQLVEEQLVAVADLLTDAATQLREADAAHMGRFMSEKLVFIFERVQHSVSKLGCCDDGEKRLMMPHDVENVRRALASFRDALLARDEPFEADLEWSYRKMDRALRALLDHATQQPYADGDLADVAADFVHYELSELRRYAAQVDADYEQGGTLKGAQQSDPEVEIK